MTRATEEDSTAGLGQALRMGRPLIGVFFWEGGEEGRFGAVHELTGT